MTESQVPLSLLISCVSGVFMLMFGIVAALTRNTYREDKVTAANRTSLAEAETKHLRGRVETLTDRLHADEVATTKLEGDLRLVTAKHDDHAQDIEEIKRTMVTRDMFEQQGKSTSETLRAILEQIREQNRRSSQSFKAPIQRGESNPPGR